MNNALIYSIHRLYDWWRHVGDHLGFQSVTVLSDQRGKGDMAVTDAFYAAFQTFEASGALSSDLLGEAEVDDVIARCRVLRWLPRSRAVAMALAMGTAMDEALEAIRPDVCISFPIDSYVSDILARRARARGIPYFEVTASALPDMCMLMHRGRLIESETPIDPARVEARIAEIADPRFTPAYVQGQAPYTRARFLRTLAYFRLRAAAFRLIAAFRRDPLNLHYLDAQPILGHKARWRDARIADLVDRDWEARFADVPRERRVLMGLQVFPEAAIDYWIEDRDLIRHEDFLFEAARRLTAANFQIAVKDHPLQFGFRQTGLLDRLKTLPDVVVIPYDVSGNAMLARCGINLTATGTLGLQAALLGDISVTGEAYYVTSDEDFVVLRRDADVATLTDRLSQCTPPVSLHERQRRIIERLMRGSFTADFYSFKGFDAASPNPGAADLGRRLGEQIRRLGPGGEDWHRRFMPPGGGRHEGSPLQ